MLCSNYFFYICYRAGGSTKHLPRPKVKRRDEESSLNDASTPKKRGKMRTYLWACLLIPTSQPHHPSPRLYKIKLRGSSKVARIVAKSLELFSRLQTRDENSIRNCGSKIKGV